jgi:hypothetical protein
MILRWFKRGKVLENKEEEKKKTRQEVFFREK